MPYEIVQRDKQYCVVNERGEIKHCYETLKQAQRLMRALYANVPDARASDADEQDERDEIYKRYHALVNMSASELERWAESECSKLASLTRAPIKRNLHLLRTPKEKWGARELRWAKRTISFVSRMRGMPRGEPAREGCPSARDIALMNWAYRPSVSRSDIRAFNVGDKQPVSCRPVSLENVPAPNTFWALAAPFNVVDAFNSYFSERTNWREDIAPEITPVFDYHGLRGGAIDVQPLGRVIAWRTDEVGRWALVQLYESDLRAPSFMRAAADCRLQVSVGMLRAGMYPQPPADGVYAQPTELLQAPVVELSLIIPDESERAANHAAIAGYAFQRSDPMTENQSPPCAQEMEALRAQLNALRAQMDRLLEEKKKAEEQAMQERALRRRDQMAQRMLQMQVPQATINDLLDIFGDIPEGAQDRLIDVVGRMIDAIRASSAGASRQTMNGDLRAALLGQFITTQQPNEEQLRQLEEDRKWIAQRFAQRSAQSA